MTDHSPEDPFVMVPIWMLTEPGHLTRSELLVYLSLLAHRNHRTGQCYPGFGSIAKEARLSRRSVIDTIPALEAKGVIHVDRAQNRRNHYTVKLPHEAFPQGCSDSTSATIAPPTEPSEAFLDSATIAPPSATTALGSATTAPQVVQPLHPNKKKITRSSNQKNKPDGTLTASASSDDDADEPFVTAVHPEPLASNAQLGLMRDLFILWFNQAPPEAQLDAWRSMTVATAEQWIKNTYSQIPRGDEYTGPAFDDPEYNLLSEKGKEFADTLGYPEPAPTTEHGVPIPDDLFGPPLTEESA